MATEANESKDVRQDPVIAGLLERMPDKIAAAFSDEQLFNLKNALGANRGRRHRVDIRGTLSWWPGRRWYYVLLAGPDRRRDHRSEPARMKGPAKLLFWCGWFLVSLAFGLLCLLILKTIFGVQLP